MKPRIPIGIIVTLEEESDSLINPRPLEAAGGVPLLLPYFDDEETVESVLDLIGGLVLTGGRDLDPQFYHESPHPKLEETEPLRDPVEMQIIHKALKRDMPILGICRGIQTINVAAGGTLYQDILSFVTTDIEHTRPWGPALDPDNPQQHHPIEIEAGSRLDDLIGSRAVPVNSYHHQAVKDLAPGFRVTARAPDGVVEAMESTDHRFVLGVQCHIELLWNKDPRWFELYKNFLEAAMSYKKMSRRLGG
jgi:putative glutamine amidotransferase